MRSSTWGSIFRIIPAYAGSTPWPCSSCPASSDHPRIRGEHGGFPRRAMCRRGSSPHTRGAPPGHRRAPGPVRIIPAYAGSTRRDRRGATSAAGSSPHTRGARGRDRRRGLPGGIIPAYAGSTSCTRGAGCSSADHPRIRGEHLMHARSRLQLRGSSPHTRGARDDLLGYGLAAGIIPAYAGSTGMTRRIFAATWDHPRIRGEHL